MFMQCTKEPVGYVLLGDRDSDPPTVFWIRPMDAEEHTTYYARWMREDGRISPDEVKAKKKIAVDREQLQAICQRIDNCWHPGDYVTDSEEIARAIALLDWPCLQELLRTAASTSALRPFQKNSSGFSSNGAGSVSATKSGDSPSSPTANPVTGSPAITTAAHALDTPHSS